jgi:hypothetical protein
MREVKFRAKPINGTDWVYGAYHALVGDGNIRERTWEPPYFKEEKQTFNCHFIFTPRLPEDIGWSERDSFMPHPVISKTVGQLTNVKDKNGVDIYEGDILRGVQKNQDDKEGVNAYPLVDTVRWANGGFEVFSKPIQKGYTKDGNTLYQFMWCDSGHHATPAFYYQIDGIEIIGNVHDSPELMTGRHDG